MTADTTSIRTALVPNEDGLFTIDVIEFEGGLWLVTEWFDNPAEGWTTPARIIRLDTIPHQKLAAPMNGAHFVVNISIPTAILNGEAQTTAKFEIPLEVRETPEIRFSMTTH